MIALQKNKTILLALESRLKAKTLKAVQPVNADTECPLVDELDIDNTSGAQSDRYVLQHLKQRVDLAHMFGSSSPNPLLTCSVKGLQPCFLTASDERIGMHGPNPTI